MASNGSRYLVIRFTPIFSVVAASGRETLNIIAQQRKPFISLKKFPAFLLAALFFIVLINVVFKADPNNLDWVKKSIAFGVYAKQCKQSRKAKKAHCYNKICDVKIQSPCFVANLVKLVEWLIRFCG